VRLQSSDDKVFTPARDEVFTVSFGTDGTVKVVAGCNRGNGTWSTTPPSGLTFGPLATTRAMCPPGSMSARFLGDFQYMRSYVIVAGGLHISLQADGGIYDFVPETVPEMSVGPGVLSVVFACKDSTGARSRIMADFAGTKPDHVKLAHKRETVTIPQVASGSGAKYEGSGVMLWNKGRDAMVTWKGVSLNCAVTAE
jgi:heat shock protein HslJ